MIRDFRVSDGPRLYDLLRTNFPEEEAAYGTRPDSWKEVVRRAYRPHLRLVVALARLVRRPIFRFFVVEEEGQIVATTLLSFAPKMGYLSAVMVAAPFRRRGYARQLLDRCHQEIAAFHRPNAVLDVLTQNAPARALYDSYGYRLLRTSTLYLRTIAPGPPAESPHPDGATVRAYESRDHRVLAALAEAAVPAEVARILPPAGRRLDASPSIDRILQSKTESWVLEEQGQPTAWVSATTSTFMEAAGLATPIVSPSASLNGVRAMLSTAVLWCRTQGASRVICRVPKDHPQGIEAVTVAGLTPSLSFDTLYRSVP